MSPLELATPLVGVPYRLHGLDLQGWDCRGCVAWARRSIFGKESPGFLHHFPELSGLGPGALAAAMQGLIAERIGAWSVVGPMPGAVVLLNLFGRPCHVGLMLDHVHFLHAMHGAGTVISRTDRDHWSAKGRVKGYFDAG